MNKKPFFAKFLENQVSEDAASAVQGGGNTTLKYPSDSEDSYPTTKPSKDVVVTMKYPSDDDEGGIDL